MAATSFLNPTKRLGALDHGEIVGIERRQPEPGLQIAVQYLRLHRRVERSSSTMTAGSAKPPIRTQDHATFGC